MDLAAYERYQATSSAPLLVPTEDHSLIPWSLADFAAGAAEWGADVVFAPSGLVRAGDSHALAAVIEAGNDELSPRRRLGVGGQVGVVEDAQRPVVVAGADQAAGIGDGDGAA